MEGHGEKELIKEVLEFRQYTAEKFWNLTENDNIFSEAFWKETVTKELIYYQGNLTKYIKRGYDGTDNPDYAKQWTFSGGFLYSLTVITTIGKHFNFTIN